MKQERQQKPINLLHLEDNPRDAELIHATLESGGISCAVTRVSSRDEFVASLEKSGFDLIITDFTLPSFDGKRALVLAREKCPDIPFIYVSGTIGEDFAVQALISGATDYILKHNLKRLVPAVQRALLEADQRKKHRQAEEELRQSEAKYRRIIETTAEGVWTLDAQGVTTFANRQMADILGRSPEELIGKPFQDVLDDDATATARKDLELLRRGEQVQRELLLGRKQGPPLWVLINATPILDKNRNFSGILVMFTDISQQKRAEENVRLQSAALESAANAVMITDSDGRILWVNPAFSRITGYSLQEIIGKNPRILKSGRQDEEFYSGIWRTILSGQVWQGEITNQKKDGSSYPEEMTVTPVRGQDGSITHFIAIKQDITERKDAASKLQQAQEQLRQAQKMEAVGRLAGGVAHDFNNLLTAILGYCNFLEAGLERDDPRLQDIKEITASANRAAGLTRQLLAFSRRQILAPKVLDLNSVIENMEKMLRRLIGEDVDLSLSLDPKLQRTKVDAGQMEQVIMNLVVNSRDAMPQGGKLTIESRNVVLDAASPGRHDLIPVGRYVMAAVSDTGCGMDEKTKSHLFEPFFTTKGQGRGTGLGLSTVYGIVKQSNGYIWVYSEPGKGSVFKIYLPATEESPEPLDEGSAGAADLRGSETVLLVEDDESVRHLLRRVLSQNGYTVLQARTGGDALQTFEHRAKEIDLVVTDVVMPEMGGRLLVDHLKSIQPDIKVIYISGYTDDAVIRHGELGIGVTFLQKPITPNVFLAKVRKVLDDPLAPSPS
jgi:PAS domain S-box-containing protein